MAANYRLKAARVLKGMTQLQLAEKVGLQEHDVSRLETGRLQAGAELKQLILATSGSPEAFGALEPDKDIAKAGVTQCQHYLPLVAEGRISVKPATSEPNCGRWSMRPSRFA